MFLKAVLGLLVTNVGMNNSCVELNNQQRPFSPKPIINRLHITFTDNNYLSSLAYTIGSSISVIWQYCIIFF